MKDRGTILTIHIFSIDKGPWSREEEPHIAQIPESYSNSDSDSTKTWNCKGFVERFTWICTQGKKEKSVNCLFDACPSSTGWSICMAKTGIERGFSAACTFQNTYRMLTFTSTHPQSEIFQLWFPKFVKQTADRVVRMAKLSPLLTPLFGVQKLAVFSF